MAIFVGSMSLIVFERTIKNHMCKTNTNKEKCNARFQNGNKSTEEKKKIKIGMKTKDDAGFYSSNFFSENLPSHVHL